MNQDSPHRDVDASHVILDVLNRLARRMWLMNSLREAAFAASVILFAILCFQLVLPAFAMPVRVALVLVCTAVILGTMRRIARKMSGRAAAVDADERAQLKDELKSALCFLSERNPSAIEQLQLRRAAVTAASLNLQSLIPRKLPAPAWAAAIAGLLLIVVASFSPHLSRARDPDAERSQEARNEPENLRSLLAGAPDRAEIAKLDLALREIQKSGLSAADRARALAEARDAIDQANMEASVAREGLAELADSLKADPKFEQVARDINEGRLEEAKSRLHDLQARGEDSAAGLDQPAAEKAATAEGVDNRPREAEGRDLPGKHASINQEAMNRVISALEQAQERIEVQARVNSVRRHMDDNLTPVNQRSQLTASQFDNRTTAVNPTPSPETGNLEIRGGTLFRQAAVAREENEESREGSRTGDASGESVAQPLEGAATPRLDARLKLETILQKREEGDEPQGKGDAGWFYSASREQKSALPTLDVRATASYQRDVAMDHDRVLLRQKGVVRNYFLNLHESEKK